MAMDAGRESSSGTKPLQRLVSPLADERGGTRLLRATLYTLAGSMGRRCAALVVGVLLARWLGREGLGIYALLMSMCVLAAVPQPAVGLAIAKLVGEAEGAGQDERLGRLVGAGLSVGFGALLMAAALYAGLRGPLSSGVYHEPLLRDLIPLGALYVVSFGFMELLGTVFQGLKAFRLLNTLTLLSALVSPLAVITLVPSLGVRGAVLAPCLVSLLTAGGYVLALRAISWRRGIALCKWPDAASLRLLAGYSVPALLSGLVGPIAFWMANTLLVRSHGFDPLGLFNVANGLAGNLPFLAAAIGVPLVPMISGASSGTAEEMAGLASRGLRAVVLSTLPFALLLALYARPVLGFLYGEHFEPAAPLLILMSVANLLIGVGSVLGSILIGGGAIWQALLINIVWMGGFLALSGYAVPRLGATGLALAFVLAYAAHMLILLICCRSRLGIIFEGLPVLGALVAVALGGAAGLLAVGQPEVLRLVAPLLILGVLLAERAVLTRNERRSLSRWLRREPVGAG